MYEVRLSPQADKFFEEADRPLANKIARCFEQLECEPRKGGSIKPLTGPLNGYYRYRIGNHRVVYRVDEPRKIVMVVIIAHRSDVYR